MVQPMVGKMILPLLGGSPGAWNTCMVFFQSLLLLGYLYAHYLTEKFNTAPHKQARIHLIILGSAIAWMTFSAILSSDNSPIAIFKSMTPTNTAYPMFGVLALLAVAIGLPFMVVSTSAPLLQKWFAYTNHPSSRDPYFLYAASNAGSLIALLGYPFYIERVMSLNTQAWFWAVGFIGLTLLVIPCATAATNPLPLPKKKDIQESDEASPLDDTQPSMTKQLRWVGLSFVPSSLMLGVTFHITTDIASMPLLWVIPLSLYLITFIIAYSRLPKWFRPVIGNLSPVVTLLLVFVLVSHIQGISTFMKLTMHIGAFFLAALMLHTELAHERPSTKYLTKYYLWISIGGVLGGIFNALIAPIVFPQAYEYIITIAIGCLLVPVFDMSKDAKLGDSPPETEEEAKPESEEENKDFKQGLVKILTFIIPLAMLLLSYQLSYLWHNSERYQTVVYKVSDFFNSASSALGAKLVFNSNILGTLLTYAVPCILCFVFIDKPIRFGLCVGAVLLAASIRDSRSSGIIESDRSFFGILRVEHSHAGDGATPPQRLFSYEFEGDEIYYINYGFSFYKLMHGTTLHGMQGIEPNAMTQELSDPLYMGNWSRADTQLWLAQARMRDQIRMLSASNGWDALLLTGMREAWDFRQEPLTYYHRTGPVGEIFREFRRKNPLGDVAMVGLGTGSAAAYALPGQKMTFYEIDPTVIDMVEKPRLMNPKEHEKGAKPIYGPFTYIDDARKRGAEIEFILGDARLKLEEDDSRKYDLLLVDAFSSDSIPIHLLTIEAIELYKQRLNPGGILALHISNRYIDLEPVVGRLAVEADLTARIWSDSKDGAYPGKTASSWVILTENPERFSDSIIANKADERFGAIAGGFVYYQYIPEWWFLRTPKDTPLWTDNYSDVISAIRMPEIVAIRRFVDRLFGVGD